MISDFKTGSYRIQSCLGLYSYLLLTFLLMAITVAANADQQQQHDPELRAILKKTINDSDSFVDRFDAEVWLVDMSGRLSRKIPNGNKRLTLLKLIHREASRAGLEPELVLALIQVESNFDRFAISRVGAQGLMQVMPFWKNEIGRPQDNLTKNSVNLKYGCTILKHYIDIEHGNLTRALARYNGSLGKLRYPEKVLDIWQKYWFVNNN